MTIGIAVSGPLAGLAAFRALSAVERVGRGDIGGFASFVAISGAGGLLTADTQRGGTATLFGAKGTPPPAFASRSEERRVGKVCGSTGRSRWAHAHETQKNDNHSRTR